MATPPTRVLYSTPAVGFLSTASPKTTPTFDVVAGDLLTVIGTSQEAPVLSSNPTTTGSITWTLRQSVVVASYTTMYVWTGVVNTTQTGITVTITKGTGTGQWGFGVTVWRNHGGVGVSGKANVSTGGPSLVLNCAANSAVVAGVSDWTATSGTSRVWRTINGSAMSEASYATSGATYTTYSGYSLDVGAAGNETVGLTAPSQKYSIVGLEILANASDDRTATGALSFGVAASGSASKAGTTAGALGATVATAGTEAKAVTGAGALGFSTATAGATAKAGTTAGSLPMSLAVNGATSKGDARTATGSLTLGVQLTAATGPAAIIVPGYQYPTLGIWAPLTADHTGVSFIIATDRSGYISGLGANSDYATAISNARAAGLRVLYYVDSAFAANSTASIIANMDAYEAYYGPADGWFIDQSPSTGQLAYLQTLYARAAGAKVVCNFGTYCDEAYISAGNACDIACVVENADSAVLTWEPAGWMANYPANRFLGISYAAPSLTTTWDHLTSRNIGNVYITDQSSFSELPTYWAAEQNLATVTPTAAKSINATGSLGFATTTAATATKAISAAGALGLAAGTAAATSKAGVAGGALPMAVGAAGSASRDLAATGTLSFTLGTAGTAAKAGTSSGAAGFVTTTNASAAKTGTTAGSLPVALSTVGATTAGLTATGSLSFNLGTTGAAGKASASTGAIGFVTATDGTTATGLTATGSLSFTLGAAGTATKAGVGSGALGFATATNGTEGKAGVSTGTLPIGTATNGTDAKAGAATGALPVTITTAGTATGIADGTAVGSLGVSFNLAGAATKTAGTAGSVGFTLSAPGAAGKGATAAGALDVVLTMPGSTAATDTRTATGSLAFGLGLAGQASKAYTAAGALGVSLTIIGATAKATAAAGAVDITVALAGDGAKTAPTVGALGIVLTATGTVLKLDADTHLNVTWDTKTGAHGNPHAVTNTHTDPLTAAGPPSRAAIDARTAPFAVTGP